MRYAYQNIGGKKTKIPNICNFIALYVKEKVKQSHYRPGQKLRAPGV